MLSQQPARNTLAACDPAVRLPWLDAVQCNCSTGVSQGLNATRLEPTSPMANYVGRSKIFLRALR